MTKQKVSLRSRKSTHSLFSKLRQNRLALFLTVFGIIGAASVVGSFAATRPNNQPKPFLYLSGPNYCRVMGNTGMNAPVVVRVSAPGLVGSEVAYGPYGQVGINLPNMTGKTLNTTVTMTMRLRSSKNTYWNSSTKVPINKACNRA